jgi:peptidoglycan/LPS O-acetylase OafA/YrhL
VRYEGCVKLLLLLGTMTYLPFVDGLRAIAVLAVVAFHAHPSAVPGGFAGVDVFFVISGFLITRFITHEMASNSFSLPRFYVRRARRLLPAALVCFVSIAVLSAFVLLPDAYWYLGRSLMSALLMYANIFFYDTGGYFTSPSLEKPLLHTWSLSIEDQFYLTWPLLLLALTNGLPRKAIVALALALALVSLGFAEFKIAQDPEFAFFQLPTRAWELLMGAILALGATSLTFSKVQAETLAIAGTVLVVMSFALLTPEAHFPGLGAVPACLGTVAIIAAGLSQQTLVSRLLSVKPVVFVGLISYSLYLWHWPLISLSSYRLERQLNVGEAVAVVAVSFVIAVLSWRYVERPFRTRHDAEAAASGATVLPPADRSFVLAAVVCTICVIGIAGALKVGKGIPQRFDGSVRTVLEQLVSGNPLRSRCDDYQNIFKNDGVCNFGRKKSAAESYEVALFGDSMADHWAPLVAKYADDKNLAGRQVTNGGCGLFFNFDVPLTPTAKMRECAAYQSEALKFVSANPGLRIAVISGFWQKWLRRIETGRAISEQEVRTLSLSSSAGTAYPRFENALADTIKIFTDRGIQVLLIGQIPVYTALPLRCVVSHIESGSDTAICGMETSAAMAELAASNQALTRAAQNLAAVSVSLPSNYMCQKTRCSPMLDGTFLYKNGGHVNQFGAQVLRKYVEFPPLSNDRGAGALDASQVR